jgi:hypothetical protein
MLKRLSAFIFILAIAGQVSAGVCNCLGSTTKKAHACCKPIDSKVPLVTSKGCCDEDCPAFASRPGERTRLNTSLKLSPGTDVDLNHTSFAVLGPSATRSAPVHIAVDQRIKYARPPDLFILHRSIRI